MERERKIAKTNVVPKTSKTFPERPEKKERGRNLWTKNSYVLVRKKKKDLGAEKEPCTSQREDRKDAESDWEDQTELPKMLWTKNQLKNCENIHEAQGEEKAN